MRILSQDAKTDKFLVELTKNEMSFLTGLDSYDVTRSKLSGKSVKLGELEEQVSNINSFAYLSKDLRKQVAEMGELVDKIQWPFKDIDKE